MQRILTIEHRAAASSPALPLQLRADQEAVALAVMEEARESANAVEPPPAERVESALATADAPLTVAALQKACRIRTATLCAILATMVDGGQAEKTSGGYRWTRR